MTNMVYPCVYREHSVISSSIWRNLGLSLCIQGTRVQNRIRKMRIRFIPVYTGNTHRKGERRGNSPVYPCVYREHRNDKRAARRRNGLSLCIQGTPLFWTRPASPSRFIPVYTGNTFADIQNLRTGAVYPCVYREHLQITPLRSSQCGLSLCIQGTL